MFQVKYVQCDWTVYLIFLGCTRILYLFKGCGPQECWMKVFKEMHLSLNKNRLCDYQFTKLSLQATPNGFFVRRVFFKGYYGGRIVDLVYVFSSTYTIKLCVEWKHIQDKFRSKHAKEYVYILNEIHIWCVISKQFSDPKT